MRRVEFSVTGGIPDYSPYGGVGSFGRTEIVGNACIGVYRPSGILPPGLSIYSGDMPWEKTESKLIDMGLLSELLPDAVILELEDFKADTSAAAGKRRAAARVLLIIASSRKWDVYGQKYIDLMTSLATHTVLTGPQALAITAAFKA